jgi:hypothetical protein
MNRFAMPLLPWKCIRPEPVSGSNPGAGPSMPPMAPVRLVGAGWADFCSAVALAVAVSVTGGCGCPLLIVCSVAVAVGTLVPVGTAGVAVGELG